jgi:hypothetical protein
MVKFFNNGSAPLTLARTKILQFSPERCGSTMIYQYLKNLLPKNKILKTHDYVHIDQKYKSQWVIVCTIRDFRDAAASKWRVNIPSKTKKKFVAGEQFMTEEEIKFNANYFNKQVDDLDEFLQRGFKIIVLKYETYYQDFNRIHSELSQFFQLTISESKKQEINQLISIEKNKVIADRFENFSKYDMTSLIHGDHIYNDGIPGFWKTVVLPEHYDLINGLLENSLKKWQYPI